MGDKAKNPGPGSYTFNYHSSLPQFSIPKSNSNWMKGTANPGPGTYESRVVQDHSSTVMGKDRRRPFYDERKDLPGPGSYNYPSVERAGGYKYYMLYLG